jgi:hypothetical protein
VAPHLLTTTRTPEPDGSDTVETRWRDRVIEVKTASGNRR